MKNPFKQSITLAVSLLLVTQSGPVAADQPIMIGRERGFDACGAISETVVQTNVYAEPETTSEIIDVLPVSVWLWDCDWHEQDGERWSGVIYRQQEGIDCGPLSSSIPELREYEGPCAFGWIRSENLILTAG